MIRALAISIFVVCYTVSASAECIPAPDWTPEAALEDRALGTTQNDRRGRVVAPISINGQGPFRFIVDTGANRSAMSAALAARLALSPRGEGQVHTVHGVALAPIVDVASLRYGSLTLPSGPMPVLADDVMAGEQGLLGVDGMQGRRLLMDFERRCIEIAPSRASRVSGPNWTTLRGEMRFGHLVVLRGRMSGIDINVLIDTGSDSTLANSALRNALATRVRRNADGRTVAYTAGDSIVLDHVVGIESVRMGDLEVRDLMAYVGDYYIFQLWQMTEEPTLMMGMDVLSQAGAMAIDYGRGTVQFRARRARR